MAAAADSSTLFMDPVIVAFDRQFWLLHERSMKFILELPEDLLYRRSAVVTDDLIKLTIGENILRSAAIVEMTFGGITTRLWDDPFEWTLPEALNDTAKVAEYLSEVEATRLRGFGFFRSDADLGRNIPAPRVLRSLGEILLDTIAQAEHFQGRAFAIFQTLGGGRVSRN